MASNRYNHILYRIEGVEWNSRASDKFFHKRLNRDISFVEYFRNQYQIEVQDPNQPLLAAIKVEPKARPGEPERVPEVVKLIPEFCQFTGGILIQPYKEDFRFKQAYSQVTNLAPTERFERLRAFLNRINQNTSADTARGWSMQLPDSPLEVSSTLLASQPIQLATTDLRELDWTRNIQNGGFLKVINLDRPWLFIYPEQERTLANSFVRTLTDVSSRMRFVVVQPVLEEYSRDRNLYAVLNAIRSDQFQMVVVMVSRRDEVMYQAIKKITCNELGVPSQVITKNILQEKKMMSCVTKVAVQMICKLGGELWGVRAVSVFWLQYKYLSLLGIGHSHTV